MAMMIQRRHLQGVIETWGGGGGGSAGDWLYGTGTAGNWLRF